MHKSPKPLIPGGNQKVTCQETTTKMGPKGEGKQLVSPILKAGDTGVIGYPLQSDKQT